MKPLFIALALLVSATGEAQWKTAARSSFPVAAIGIHNGSVFFALSGSTVFRYGGKYDSIIPSDSGLYPDQKSKIIAFASSKDYAFCAASNGWVYRSSDYGKHWSYPPPPGRGSAPTSLIMVDTILFCGPNYKSIDYGQTDWLDIAVPPLRATSFAVSGDTIIAGSNPGVAFSTDKGVTWSFGTIQLPGGGGDPDITCVGIVGTTVFAGTRYRRSIYRSADWGQHWDTVLTTRWPINALAVSGHNIFAATGGGGIYLSQDSGNIWTTVNDGLVASRDDSLSMISFAIQDSIIWAGGTGTARGAINALNGLYSRPLSEMIQKSAVVESAPQRDTISIYPNPTLHSLTIESSEELRTVELLDVLGVSKQLRAPRMTKAEIDLSQLPSGTYFLRIETAKGTEFRKVIRE